MLKHTLRNKIVSGYEKSNVNGGSLGGVEREEREREERDFQGPFLLSLLPSYFQEFLLLPFLFCILDNISLNICHI